LGDARLAGIADHETWHADGSDCGTYRTSARGDCGNDAESEEA
jgi:hypothetical protein